MTHKVDINIVIRTYIAAAGSQKEAAKRLGISPQYLSDIVLGRREPGAKVLKALGLRKVVTYERAE